MINRARGEKKKGRERILPALPEAIATPLRLLSSIAVPCVANFVSGLIIEKSSNIFNFSLDFVQESSYDVWR